MLGHFASPSSKRQDGKSLCFRITSSSTFHEWIGMRAIIELKLKQTHWKRENALISFNLNTNVIIVIHLKAIIRQLIGGGRKDGCGCREYFNDYVLVSSKLGNTQTGRWIMNVIVVVVLYLVFDSIECVPEIERCHSKMCLNLF